MTLPRAHLGSFFGDPFADGTSLTARNFTARAASSAIAVTRDATSNIYTPVSSSEWATFRAAFSLTAPAPDSLWLLQEASGNPADSIGSFTLTAAGTVTYRQALAGYTRLGVGLTDGVNSQFGTASGSLPAGGTGSQTVLMIANIPSAPAANRSLYEGQTTSLIRINSTPRVVAVAGGGTSLGGSNPTGTTRPFVYKCDVTGTAETVYTNQEKLSPVYAALSGRNLRIGSSTSAPGAVVGYACAWYSANAEISDANMKALLQAMGFTIPW